MSIGNANTFLKISHLILDVIFMLPNANRAVTSTQYRDSFFMSLQASPLFYMAVVTNTVEECSAFVSRVGIGSAIQPQL